MSDSRKVPVIIPNGVPWPSDLPVPEIEVTKATIRRTKIGKDGVIEETVSTVDLPVVPNNSSNDPDNK